MAGGLFNRLKVWIYQDYLASADLNGEINNVISHMSPQYISGWEATVLQMQLTENPGLPGSENLGTSLADDIQQLRYMFVQVIGGSYWYSLPNQSLNSVSSSIGSPGFNYSGRIQSGRVSSFNQPLFLQAGATTTTAKLLAASVNFIYYINGSQVTQNSDVTSPSLNLAPGSNNTAALINALTTRDTLMEIGTVGSAITAMAGKWGCYQIGSEVIFAYNSGGDILSNCVRGAFFDGTDANNVAAAASIGGTVTLLNVGWLFLNSSTGAITVTYDAPAYSYAQPASPTTGDFWFSFSASKWMIYNGAAFVDSRSVLLGMAVTNGSACIMTKSFDFYRSFSSINTLTLSALDSTDVGSVTAPVMSGFGSQALAGIPGFEAGFGISVYGTFFSSKMGSEFIWNTTTSLDTGLSLSASTVYFCYVTDLGDLKITPIGPIDRRFDLQGWYHPAKPWRCVGQFSTDSSKNVYLCPSFPNISNGGGMAVATTTSTTFVNAAGATTDILTSGSPVRISLVPATTASASFPASLSAVTTSSTVTAYMDIQILRDGVLIPGAVFRLFASYQQQIYIPPGAINFIDYPPPGQHSYMTQFKSNATTNTAGINETALQVEEILSKPWPQ